MQMLKLQVLLSTTICVPGTGQEAGIMKAQAKYGACFQKEVEFQSWAGHLASLSLSFLIRKVGMTSTLLTSQSCYWDQFIEEQMCGGIL